MITVKEFTTGTEVLTSSYIRYEQREDLVLVMLSGGMNQQANALKRNTLYALSVTTDEGEILLDSVYCRFISYNCQYNTSVVDNTTLVVTDNTVLFERLN